VPVTTDVRNLSTSFVFCLSSRRGEQAVDVKGKPEALRQAFGITKGWTLARVYGIPEHIYGNWRCSKSRGKRLVSSARRVIPLEKGEIGRPDHLVRTAGFGMTGLPVFTDGSA
jgi:hypothetical protein